MDVTLLCDQAVAFHKDGNLAEAERLYTQILAAEPSSFAGQHLLGVLRHQQGRNPEALELISAALKIHPDIPEALSNYGLVLKALGRWDEALAQYDKALAFKPDFAVAQNNKGIVLADMNRLEEALASYDAALTIRPAYAEALSNRGRVLQFLGRFDAARDSYLQSLALDPGRTNVYLDYLDSVKLRPGDPQLGAMEALAGNTLTDTERLQLDFALAKAHDDLGHHERSIQHLLSANALKRAQIQYDEAATMGFFDRIQAQFTAPLLREKEKLHGVPAAPMPVFILGMMRSGSTLVEQILASHPAVQAGGELPAMSATANAWAGPDGALYPEYAPSLDASALAQIGGRYLESIHGLAAGSAYVTDKMPANFYYAGLIHLALSGAPIIHTLRDPVDNCLSCFSKLFTEEQNHTYDLAELGRYYRRYQALMTHWHRVLPPARILDVRYEDLVADLEGQARRIIAYCGLPWDARCLSFHTNSRPVKTASLAQVRQPIYKNAVGRARAYEEFLGPLKAALNGQ